jgi:hypothetical protein
MPLRKLVEAVNDARPADLERALGEYLNVDTFIKEIAVQNFVAQTDGLLGDFGMTNFYLYRFDQKRLAQLIPWDQDGSFRTLDMPPWQNMGTNVLAAKIWSEPEYRERYLRTLLEVADLVGAPTVDDPSARTCPAADAQPCSWLEEEVLREYVQIRDSVYADPLMPYPTAEFEQDVAAIERFARDRAEIVRRYVAQVAPDLRATGVPLTKR